MPCRPGYRIRRSTSDCRYSYTVRRRKVFFRVRVLTSFLSFCRPQSLLSGMNRFLASLEITFRRDPTNFRPRVNKLHSVKDREQKGVHISFIRGFQNLTLSRPIAAGNYFFLEE